MPLIIFLVPYRVSPLISLVSFDSAAAALGRTEVSDWTPLIVTLMVEDHKADSPWRPYLDVLPRDLSLCALPFVIWVFFVYIVAGGFRVCGLHSCLAPFSEWGD